MNEGHNQIICLGLLFTVIKNCNNFADILGSAGEQEYIYPKLLYRKKVGNS